MYEAAAKETIEWVIPSDSHSSVDIRFSFRNEIAISHSLCFCIRDYRDVLNGYNGTIFAYGIPHSLVYTLIGSIIQSIDSYLFGIDLYYENIRTTIINDGYLSLLTGQTGSGKSHTMFGPGITWSIMNSIIIITVDEYVLILMSSCSPSLLLSLPLFQIFPILRCKESFLGHASKHSYNQSKSISLVNSVLLHIS